MAALAFYLFSALLLGSAAMVVTVRNPVHGVFFLILAFFNAAGLFVLLHAEFLAMMLVVVYVGAIAVLFLFVVMMLDIKQPASRQSFSTKLRLCLFSLLGFFIYTIVLAICISAVGGLIIYGTKQLTGINIDITDPGANAISTLLLAVLLGWGLAEFLCKQVFKDNWRKIFRSFYQDFPFGPLIFALLILEVLAVTFVTWRRADSEEILMAPTPPDMVLSNTHALGQLIYTDYIYVFQSVGLILLVAMIGAIVLTLRRRPDVKRQNVGEQIQRQRAQAVELRTVVPRTGLKGS